MSLFPQISERVFPDYPAFPRTPSDDAREAFRLFEMDDHSGGGQLARQALDFEPTNDLAACAWAVAASFYMVKPPSGDYIDSLVETARACAVALLAGPAPASLAGITMIPSAAPLPEDGGLARVIQRLGHDRVDRTVRRLWTDPTAAVAEGVRLAPEWPRFWIAALTLRQQGYGVLYDSTTEAIRTRALAGAEQEDGGDWAQASFGCLVSYSSWTRAQLIELIAKP